jgi:nicotinamidase-related amidase
MDTPVLLIIDVQRGLDHPSFGRRNNPGAEARMAELLAAWRTAGLPVIHVQHLSVRSDSPLRPGQPGCDIKPEVAPAPGEPHFTKSVNNAFLGTGLAEYLRDRGCHSLVVVGLTTDHCVSSTVRAAADLGFAVTLVSDATATFERTAPEGTVIPAEQVHAAHLASLEHEFCQVSPAARVLASIT